MTTEVQFKIDSEFPTCWNKEMHTIWFSLWESYDTGQNSEFFFFIIWGILFQLDKV